MLNIDNTVKNLKDFGYFKINNFLNENEIKKLRKMAYGKTKGSESQNRYFPYTYLMVFKKFLKLDFVKLKQGLEIINIMKKKPELKSIIDGVFEKKNKLTMVDAYTLKDGQNIEWHTDYMLEKNNQNRLILFIFLDPVSKSNGSMGYVKNSHKIVNFLKKGFIENKIDNEKLKLKSEEIPLLGDNFSLEFLLKLMNNNYDYLVEHLKDNKIIDNFVVDINSIINQKETDKFFDLMIPGDAIIFNQSGIHGGTQTKSERSIMRFHWWTEK